jgi:hypothetical protein
MSEAQKSPSNSQHTSPKAAVAGSADESPNRQQRRANGDVIELPPPMTEEEKAAARNRNGGDFHRRVDALYDLIDSAGDGRSDGYLTFAELQQFFQGSEEKALQYISQIDGYAGVCAKALRCAPTCRRRRRNVSACTVVSVLPVPPPMARSSNGVLRLRWLATV